MRKDALRIYLRIYGELKRLAKPKLNTSGFTETIAYLGQSIKDYIEGIGIPHTEVFLVLVNDCPVKSDYRLSNEDRISVYPHFKNIDLQDEILFTPKYYGEPKFILDIHLGTLAKVLRMLGFYTDYGIVEDEKISQISSQKGLIVLTKDRGLLKRNKINYGMLLHSKGVFEQVLEINERFSLKEYIKPFTRCLECNGEIVRVDRKEVIEFLPEKVKNLHNEFAKCSNCGQIYWKGTHYEKMEKTVEKILEELR